MRQEIPLTILLGIKLFDMWGIHFMGPFLQSFGNLYILVAVDCVSMWIETMVTPSNDAKVVTKFLVKTFFPNMARLESSLVTREPIFAINYLKS